METTPGTTGERRFLLYNYLIRNTGKGRVATRKQIFDHLKSYGIEISVNTFYADLTVLQGEIYNLEIEFDQKRNGYWVKNPPFTKDELGQAVGRSSLAIAAFTDPAMALAFVKALGDPEKYRQALEDLDKRAARIRQRQTEEKAHQRNKRMGAGKPKQKN